MDKPSLIIGTDHGGFELKEAVVAHLKSNGYDVEDIGCYSTESVDYPDYANRVARAVVSGEKDLGILCCTTGIGMSVAANRFPGFKQPLLPMPISPRRLAFTTIRMFSALPGSSQVEKKQERSSIRGLE